MTMRRCLLLLVFTTTLLAVSVHASPCAPSHTLCGAGGNHHHHRGGGFESGDSVASMCCPSDTHVCQRTAHAYRCVAKVEAEVCRSCCAGGACTFATGALLPSPLQDREGGRMLVPEIKALQCCGVSGERAYCCPTRASPAAAAEAAAAASSSSSSSPTSSAAASTPRRATGFMQPTAPQQCKAVPNAWECVDLPSSVMQVTVSLAMWQLILCIVGGVLCCGALTGGGHRYHGGHCNDDCQACTAFLGGCLLFQCCRGGKGAGEPLLG